MPADNRRSFTGSTDTLNMSKLCCEPAGRSFEVRTRGHAASLGFFTAADPAASLMVTYWFIAEGQSSRFTAVCTTTYHRFKQSCPTSLTFAEVLTAPHTWPAFSIRTFPLQSAAHQVAEITGLYNHSCLSWASRQSRFYTAHMNTEEMGKRMGKKWTSVFFKFFFLFFSN